MRSSILCLFVLFCFSAISAPSFAAKPVDVDNAVPAVSFRRGSPLPKWALPLAEVPPTHRTDVSVVRLSESQTWVGDNPATLVNRAVQINEKSALGAIGEVSLNYYPIYQKLLLHRVAIIRDGKTIDRTASVGVRLLQRESAMESGMFGGATTLHLLLDDVRVGDTLWLTYTIEGANPVFGKRWSDDFTWESDEPIELRRVTVLHPKERSIQWRQLGDFRREELKPQIDEQAGIERLRFEERGIEALDDEPSIPSDYFAARELQFTEYADWHAVAAWADGLFPRVADSPVLNNLVRKFSGASDAATQAAAALHWVQSEVRYFSVSIGENSHRPQAPETVIARRYGDCKDKSYLLVSILARLGIEAHPVLLASDAPKAPAHLMPTPSWFDHVIVQVKLDGREYFVDPTDEGQAEPLEKLPSAFPGASGLVVAQATQGLTVLPERNESDPSYEVVEKIGLPAIDGDATIETQLIFRGVNADVARQHFPELSPNELKKDILAMYEKEYPGITLQAVPGYHDDAAANRVEVTASFIVPKPIEHKNKHYYLQFESKVLRNTLPLPDNIVRNYPLAIRHAGYSGRYLLNVSFPPSLRAQEAPVSRTIENGYFGLHEEYLYHGNQLDYRVDYVVKAASVAPTDMQDYAAWMKKLDDAVEGNFNLAEESFSKGDAMTMPIRDLDSLRLKNTMVRYAKNLSERKEEENVGKLGCALMLDYLYIADVYGDAGADGWAQARRELAKDGKSPGARLCTARLLAAKGRFAESVPLYQAEQPLADENPLTLELAWSRYYANDYQGALADLERYRNARSKADGANWDAADVGSEILLYRRLGEALPADLLALASEMPDGPWPRPLLAMEAGLISPDALQKTAEAYAGDARELALDAAWYGIGQRALAEHDTERAAAAFRWFESNGMRSSGNGQRARVELERLQPGDANSERAWRASEDGDYKTANALWRLSAEAGLASSQDHLAQSYYYGYAVDVDYGVAMHWARMAADQGFPHAQNLVGVMYALGRGVPTDEKLAVAWYEKAAANGDVNALSNLGTRYRDGGYVEQDLAKAEKYFLSAAERGDIESQVALATLYSKEGSNKLADAVVWARRATLQGSLEAKALLGGLYLEGRGIAADTKYGLTLLHEAADKGNARAELELGWAYESGLGVGQDDRLAMSWQEKAASHGEAFAQVLLGLHYLEARGVPADPDKAFRLLEGPARLGEELAQASVGMMYARGMGVKKDPQQAIHFLRLAAAKGNLQAQVKLGNMLYFGQGVDKEPVEARGWYEKASAQGSGMATNNLGDIYENGAGVPQDLSQALKFYRQAASDGHLFAFISLSTLYKNGLGVPRDAVLAYTYATIGVQSDEPELAKERRKELARELTADQRQQAEADAAAWKKGMPLPGERAM